MFGVARFSTVVEIKAGRRMLVKVMNKQLACKPGSASLLAGVIEKGWVPQKSPGLGLRYEWITVMGRPAFWQASMNEVNASPVSPLPE